LQSPNGGELWYKGQTNFITWSSGTNADENVKIELYREGRLYSTITNSMTNTGTKAWALTSPMLNSTNYQIRISSVTQTNVWDMSDAPFIIAPAPFLTLLFENFDAGTSLPAGWSQTNLSGSATTWKFQTGGKSGGSNPTTAHSVPYNACLYDTTSNSDLVRLSPPTLNMSGCTGAVLRFWHHMKYWAPDQDYLNVWVKTNVGASWLRVAGFSNSVASWTQQSLPLPNPGTNYTLAFEGIARFGYGVCLDDVEVLGYSADITTVTNNTPLSWLANYGIEATDAGAMSDTDNDGLKAWEEWIAGTSPTQFLSVLKVSNSWSAANESLLVWDAVTGRTYSVFWSSNLTAAAFESLTSSNTTGIYTDALHSAEQSRFYRIGVKLNP
jgi:hypothetical protein